MTFDEVVELLKSEYEKAKQLDFVQRPLAYALYKTWKIVDKKRVKESKNETRKKADQKAEDISEGEEFKC